MNAEGNWFIDALDPDAGIAFASLRGWRDRDATDGDGQAVVIAPPYFHPEVVSSRALSLTAINHGAQPGVFLSGEEVAFGSLAELVEFVRKAYLAGGAGGGPSGEIPPVVPIGPDEGGDDDRRIGAAPQDSGPGPNYRRAAHELAAWLMGPAGEWLEGGKVGAPMPPPTPAIAIVVANASAIVALALLERLPRDDTDFEAWRRWEVALGRFRMMAQFLSVRSSLVAHETYEVLGSWVRRLIREPNHWLSGFGRFRADHDVDLRMLGSWMFGILLGGRMERPPWARPPAILTRMRALQMRVQPENAFRILASLPVPREMAETHALETDASVADHLAVCSATGRLGPRYWDDVGLMIMAACFIVGAPESGPSNEISWPDGAHGERMLLDAMDWLKRQCSTSLPERLIDMVAPVTTQGA
jgi:hypothetical protein